MPADREAIPPKLEQVFADAVKIARGARALRRIGPALLIFTAIALSTVAVFVALVWLESSLRLFRLSRTTAGIDRPHEPLALPSQRQSGKLAMTPEAQRPRAALRPRSVQIGGEPRSSARTATASGS